MILSFLVAVFTFPADLLYWLKWSVASLAIRVHIYFHGRRFDLYDVDSEDDPFKLGFLVPPLETELESPFPEQHAQKAADEILFYGINSKSEHLLVRVVRGPEGTAEACVQLRLQDGRAFQLHEHAGFQNVSAGQQAADFSCGRLHMRFLLPMRCWRIHFCGMLKETTAQHKTATDSTFVKFVFLWKASSNVYDLNFHTDRCGIASAMAKASWDSNIIPPIQKFVETFNFYGQSGVITGAVSIDGEEDYEMYLFGEKARNMGKYSNVNGGNFVTIMGRTPANGFAFHAAKSTIPSIVQELPYGFIVRPDTIMESIEDVNLTMKEEDSPKVFELQFKTAGSTYKLAGKTTRQPIYLQGRGDFIKINFVEFELNGKKGCGLMMCGEYRKSLNAPIKKSDWKILPLPTVIPLTVKFSEDVALFEEVSGGKGASLSKLTKFSSLDKSFAVPKGIVITTQAYKEFVNNDIKKAVKELEGVVYGNKKNEVQDTCNRVSEIVIKSPLPEKVCSSIIRDLKSTFGDEFNNLKFAVRSSATGEDTEAMSAAGQMDTFLGVQEIKNIFIAVKKCWASQFGHIAVEYKRRNGQPLNCPMAVVVQEMVACDIAGVLFTCDPVTGNPSKVAISANYGLGETIVSGTVEPDNVVLNRTIDDDVTLESVTIGGKHEKIILLESGGVTTESLDEDSKSNTCLSSETAERLGALGIRVENYYRSPRDIEWGMVGKQIYLLQSRPVTSMMAATDYEILHEFDTALRYESEYFSKANVGETMPGAMSPLGVEFFFKNFVNCASKVAKKSGAAEIMFQSKYFMTGCIQFYNHLMLGVAELMCRHGLGTISSKGFMVALFGRVLDDPELLAVVQDIYPSSEHPPKSLYRKACFMWDLLSHGAGSAGAMKKLREMDTVHAECKTSMELFQAIVKDWSKYEEPFKRHLSSSENSSIWNIYLFEILCKANNGEFNTNVFSDFSRLLTTSSDVESADVPQALQILADQIEKDVDSAVFKNMKFEEAEKWLKTSKTSSAQKFKELLNRHGHRCIQEFDVLSKTWDMDCKPLIELLQNTCGTVKTKKAKPKKDSELISDLNVTIGFLSKIYLKFVLPNCRKAVVCREFSKSMMVKSIDNWRKGCHRLAALMVAEGRIPDPDLIFFFRLQEMYDLLKTRSPGIVSRAIHRKRVFADTVHLNFPEVMRGLPIPINIEDDTDAEVADLVMNGVPVSHGTAKGYARVALNVNEAAQLKSGEILIAYCTDIGWSPYFPIIAGVVTELGGIISHGAVVSREYGLPCVVGLHGATKKFKTGDYVLIDGKKGFLKRLSPPTK